VFAVDFNGRYDVIVGNEYPAFVVDQRRDVKTSDRTDRKQCLEMEEIEFDRDGSAEYK